MKQTSLDLNGPILSFVQNPNSLSVCSGGTTSFVAIATATFPIQTPSNPASNTGSLSYSWYAEGFGKLTDGTFQQATISGSGTTTLIITNPISPNISQLNVFAGVDYIPSAYSQPVGSAVTVGTARSTGNAINEILFSNSATLNVFPTITITTQPANVVVEETATASFSVVAQSSDNIPGNLSYQWTLNGTNLTNSSTVSGATTPNLQIAYPVIGINTVQVRISHPTSCDSPVLSNVVQFSIIPVSANVVVETITNSSTTATVQVQDLLVNQELTLLAQNFTDPSTLISMYARERDINVEMDIFGGKGSDSGSNSGGQGGYSRIRFLMRRNEEYIIAGMNVSDNNPFIYRKGTLISVVGKGGDASTGGRGGAGGGIGVSGESGTGRSAGSGGSSIPAGTLSSSGILGSASSLQPLSPDTKASVPNAGRTLPCSKGTYWRQQGLSACQDIGISQFRLSDGRVVTNTGSITRGYKSGYNIIQTAGSGVAPTTQSIFVPRTCTRTIPQTCYRTVPRTCTRTVSRSVTKSTSFNHVFNNVPGDFRTISLTSSGDPMTITTSGEQSGVRAYNINISGLGLNSTNYTVSVTNSNQSAAGDFPGIAVNRIVNQGLNINLTFTNLTNGAITFCRDFTVTINGTANFTESYDCSFTESFDCSYTEQYDCSYTDTVTIDGGANGGNGATGGSGGGSTSGGGGGSGYTDGSVTVVNTQLGGSNSFAKIILRTY
jgi:uncharacterized membrane protein YgcG